MKIKVFNIRLSNEFFQKDQDLVNEFLANVLPQKTYTHFVTSEKMDYWSAVIFYKEKEITENIFINLNHKIFKA